MTTLHNLDIPNSKLKTLMETTSLNAIKYLTHMVLNKHKLEKRQAPIPLNLQCFGF